MRNTRTRSLFVARTQPTTFPTASSPEKQRRPRKVSLGKVSLGCSPQLLELAPQQLHLRFSLVDGLPASAFCSSACNFLEQASRIEDLPAARQPPYAERRQTGACAKARAQDLKQGSAQRACAARFSTVSTSRAACARSSATRRSAAPQAGPLPAGTTRRAPRTQSAVCARRSGAQLAKLAHD